MSNPLIPSPSLLCKLSSAIVHADEMIGVGGHTLDRTAFLSILADPEVCEWLSQMDAMAMIPKKRVVVKRTGPLTSRKPFTGFKRD